jgi:sortase B
MKTVKKKWHERLRLNIKYFLIKSKPVDRKDWIRVSVLAIAIPLFLYSAGQLGFKLFTYVYEDYKHGKIIDQLPDNKDPFDDLEGLTPFPDGNDLPYQVVYGTDSYLNDSGILVEYEELRTRNNEMVGWIRMPGFAKKPINYPIMYSGDNDFYVYRDFDKNTSYSGSIFLDGANTPYHVDPLKIDRNLVIYGHAMKNLSMFGNLTDYFRNQKVWETTRYIYIDLMNTRLEYEVVSTFLTTAHFNYRQTRFTNDTQFLSYINEMITKSANDFNAPTITPNDKFVTLSTCYKTTQRTAVIGRLVRQIIYLPDPDGGNPNIIPIPLPSGIPMNEPSPTPILTPTPTPEISITPGVPPTGSVTPTPGADLTPTVTPAPEPANLIPNPGFEEEDISLWKADNAILERSQADAASGEYSLFVSDREDASSSVSIDLTEFLITAGSGRYSFETMMKALEGDHAARIVLRLVYKDSTVKEYGLVDLAISGADWTNIGGKDQYLSRIATDEDPNSSSSEASSEASSEPSSESSSSSASQASVLSSESQDPSESLLEESLQEESLPEESDPEESDPDDILEFSAETLESAILYITTEDNVSFYIDDVFFGKEVIIEDNPSDEQSSDPGSSDEQSSDPGSSDEQSSDPGSSDEESSSETESSSSSSSSAANSSLASGAAANNFSLISSSESG